MQTEMVWILSEHPFCQTLLPMFFRSWSLCCSLQAGQYITHRAFPVSAHKRPITTPAGPLAESQLGVTLCVVFKPVKNSNRIPAPDHHRLAVQNTKTKAAEPIPVINVMFLYFQVDPMLQVRHPRKSRQSCAMCVRCTLCSGVLTMLGWGRNEME